MIMIIIIYETLITMIITAMILSANYHFKVKFTDRKFKTITHIFNPTQRDQKIKTKFAFFQHTQKLELASFTFFSLSSSDTYPLIQQLLL
jgi:hypothetical protein